MKKGILVFSSLMAASLSASSWAEEINYYVIGQQAQPFQIEENGANHSGIVTDIVEEIFTGSGYELVYHTFPFNRMISQLEAGGEKNWVTYGSPNWGGVQADNLSTEPIYMVEHVLVTGANGEFEYTGIDSLKGKGVILLHGFDYPELEPYIASGDIEEIRVKDYQAAFRVASRMAGEAAFVEMASRINYNLDKLGLDKSKFEILSFSNVIAEYPIHLALQPDMPPEIQDYINDRLADIKTNGKLSQIVEQY